MKIGRKLIYYGFGVILGLLAVNFFWDQRDIKMTYFPSARIQHDFNKKELAFSKESVDQLNSFAISKTTVRQKIEDRSFDASLLDRDAKPCKIYLLESDIKGVDYGFRFQNCDSLVTLMTVNIKEY